MLFWHRRYTRYLQTSYRGGYFRIYSSMALTDNLFNNESYYIVEIKSLKRIMDALAGDTLYCALLMKF